MPPLVCFNSYLIAPAFLADIRIKPESQQVRAYELKVHENISLKAAFSQALVEISVTEKSSFDCKNHVRCSGNKVLDKVL
jgi:hypothetical protein